jgi:creatinine amidohydrolase/Fe(II)-dependent formamide hydrolase-like protein
MSSQDISDYVEKTPKEKQLVLIVWGVLESHGPYLPVASDSLMSSLATDTVAMRLYKEHGIQPIIFNSWMDIGSRSATWEFPGSIGFHSDTPVIREMWNQTLERMVHWGFRKFYVVNGDGGNWMNHWYGLQWDSDVIRKLVKEHDIILRGSNWDAEGGSEYLHAGARSHALCKWACEFSPEFVRLATIRHGLRSPRDEDVKLIENDQPFLEAEPYREMDWSKFPGQNRLRSVTKLVYSEYLDALYNTDGTPRTSGGVTNDFEGMTGALMKKVLTAIETQ